MNAATYATYEIRGGDYERGGAASKQLKEILKKLGVEPKTIRRTMVAAYEAEMNTVIHARGGAMRVAVDAFQVDVVVEDEGPGIPDVQQAMKEGFSTAPAAARALGFGAGMGLPNIRKNADRFSVQTVPGKGTQVRFRIFLEPLQAVQGGAKSIHVMTERCRRCLQCVRACPTGAVRVREEGPEVLDHLCIDCASCIAVCRDGALTMGESADELPERTDDTVLVVPAALLEQFGAGVGPEQVFKACHDIGFLNVRFSDDWERALRKAVAGYARSGTAMRPVLSPMCPAVVNLIRVRFPSLLGHLAPFLTPMEAAREGLAVPHAAFVALCPAQVTAIRVPNLLTRIDIVPARALCGAILPRVAGAVRPESPERRKTPLDDGQEALQVSGMRHVEKVLNEVEDGLMPDCPVLELFGCDQGCFGSPVWLEDPFVARRRYEEALEAAGPGAGACAIRRIEAIGPRTGLRLDPDMKKAIEKLRRIDSLTRELPGRDCGACGAPTCAALAEDIVLGRTSLDACLYLTPTPAERKP